MKILFLSTWYPAPPNNGSKLRTYHLLRGLSAQHDVTLLSFRQPHEVEDPDALAFCRAVQTLPVHPYRPNSLRALLGLFSPQPRVLVDRYSPEMAAAIRATLAAAPFDLVIAAQWYLAAYAPHFGRVPAIFEEAELGIFLDKVAQARSPLARLRHRLTQWKMRWYFRQLMHRFAAVTVASEQERRIFADFVPTYSQVVVIRNGVRVADYAAWRDGGPRWAAPEPHSLIYPGSFQYAANYEAMVWFLERVWPQVRAALPDARLRITGEHAGLPLPTTDGVILTGLVPDVRPLVAESWAALAPLQSGGGTRLKILEAMALGTPVVATSKGAEGLGAQPGEHLLVADDPADFAAAVLRLLQDARLRRDLSRCAQQWVAAHYDWDEILPEFLQLAAQVGATRPREAQA